MVVFLVDTRQLFCNTTAINITGEQPWNVQRLSRKGVGPKRARSAQYLSVENVVQRNDGYKDMACVNAVINGNGGKVLTIPNGIRKIFQMVVLNAGLQLGDMGGRVCAAYVTSVNTIQQYRASKLLRHLSKQRDAVYEFEKDTRLIRSFDANVKSTSSTLNIMGMGLPVCNGTIICVRPAVTANILVYWKSIILTGIERIMNWEISLLFAPHAIKRFITNLMASDNDIVRHPRQRGQTTEAVVFPTTDSYIHEHNLKIGGRWGNFVTCTKDFAPCPVCEQGHKPTYTAYYSAIDTREFTLQKGPNAGKKVKNRRVLFPAKGATINLIRDFQKKHKGLVGRKFKAKRMGERDPNCGRDFEALGKINIAKLPKDDRTPYEYEVVLAPMGEEELAALGFNTSVVGGDEEVGGTVDLDKLTDLE